MKSLPFGKRKKEEQKNFNFQVEGVIPLEHGMGVLVVGQITEGVIRQGDRAVCVSGVRGGGEFSLCH